MLRTPAIPAAPHDPLARIEERIARFVERHQPRFAALADEIWSYAEIGYAEHRSSAAQRDVLRDFGFRVDENLAGMPTAFVGERITGGGADTTIAFLGELDALPGLDQAAGQVQRSGDSRRNGHACGHHLLGSGALLAAVAAADCLAEQGIAARVRYYGCPAEENGIGKSFLARAGHFDDVSVALTWHPGATTGIMTGPILANIQAYFRFTGRAAHAAAAPHLGRSALDAVELMNVGVNYLREHMPPDARVHYAITDSGGTAPNVVQATSEVLYLVRSPSAAELKSLYERVCRIAEGAALMTETRVAVRIDKATGPMLHNQVLDQHLNGVVARFGAPSFDATDQALARQFQAILSAEEIAAGKRKFQIAADYAQALDERVMPYLPFHPSVGGSSDVADVSWVVPTAQIWCPCFAIGTPGHSWQNTAQGKTAYAHKGMVHAAKLLAIAGVDLVAQSAVVTAARHELETSRQHLGTPDLLPDDVVPPTVEARNPAD